MSPEEFREKHKNDPILSKIEDLKQGDILRILNASYIAERFFGKSGSWLSQKINNHLKNGKPCYFTKEELETLSNALYTLSIELMDVADDLRV
ncbi:MULTISPECIES: DUF5053 domain-containing protein [Bacteroidales]|jgi:hypothetical protein|uniref:DUF5053 domain-containing protein n=1 Tax=Bacteroidales TaxID=171549 RepID=UPI0026E2DA0C|nr:MULTISPECIES: DUF5053 domain-containing protein [Bacteroidales]